MGGTLEPHTSITVCVLQDLTIVTTMFKVTYISNSKVPYFSNSKVPKCEHLFHLAYSRRFSYL